MTHRDMTWQNELSRSYRTADELLQAGLLSHQEFLQTKAAFGKYQFLLPRYYASLIDRKNPNCPIRLQAIPRLSELLETATFVADPLEDLSHKPVSRITHRYQRRVLIHLTPNCSMYCRFCFRKTLLNELSPSLFEGSLDSALHYVKEKRDIEEVIFSGGDPFMVNDSALADVIGRLERIEHITRIRFHTRVPVTFPMRVTEELVRIVSSPRIPTVVVTHFNHPQEVTVESAKACTLLRKAGVHLLNQTVLLAGVNNASETLSTLSRRVFEMGILPYYLHHPDRSAGTAHFDLSIQEGKNIYRKLREELPGYLVPKYVVDLVGQPFKVDVTTL